MNKNVLIGLVAGIGIAVAGGVAGFTLMNDSSDAQEEMTAAEAVESAATATTSQEAPAQNVAVAGSEPAPVFVEECWDEEVEVPAEVRDDKAIAGTAAGALIGGALADRLGDDDDLVTAAGAAAGAFLGRRAQREYQENRTTTTTVRRCAQVQQ
ncbi:MAG: glycine zipper 2TM domain-containing protein [Gammaproteobacteria bacterium]|jgi:uncharacterized protein YcfJ